MLRGLTKTLFRASTRFPRTTRFFSEEAPAISKGNQAAGSAALSKYVNGELVTRTQLTLKKKEDIESFVINVIKDYFRTTNKTGLKSESNLADHGLDSLDSIEISMRIEEELGYVISAETLPVLTKVKHFVNYIAQVEAFKEKHGKAPLA